ncbi:major royal jelly protein 2-like [Copidosoma floridanum]|uniref:major royal jelly protein 2-like n=1 Tax=Copidosoma floridanum TaxID=29053 RepID=UPI0006C99B59|nr:major royal jelly protein 2-like [Copidosoma floridanum]
MRVTIFIIFLVPTLTLAAYKMKEVYEWKFVDFLWPSKYERIEAIQNGTYNRKRIIPMDVDKDRDGRVFVTLLGATGVPATLGIVTNKTGPWGHLIKPYPNWSWFRPNDCNSIQSVHRIAIDKCNRLWILDVGFKMCCCTVCPPKLVVFDLDSDVHLKTVIIPDSITKYKRRSSIFVTPVVDTKGPQCEKTTVYIADTHSNTLIIYDGQSMRSLNHNTFNFDHNAQILTSGVNKVKAKNGILGLAISPQVYPTDPKFLYYRPLSSKGLFAANINELERSFHGENVNYFGDKELLPSQAVAMAFSSNGTLFFGLTKESSIGCYNQYKKLVRGNIGIVDQDNERLGYLNGVKVIKSSKKHPIEELWVLSNHFVASLSQSFMQNDKVKFRVLKGSVENLVKGTVCG